MPSSVPADHADVQQVQEKHVSPGPLIHASSEAPQIACDLLVSISSDVHGTQDKVDGHLVHVAFHSQGHVDGQASSDQVACVLSASLASDLHVPQDLGDGHLVQVALDVQRHVKG